MKKAFLILAAVMLLPGVLFAYAKLGNPTGFVNDYAGMLTSEQKGQLETTLSEYEKQSTNEISVVIIKTLDGDTIENFAVKLFEDWKIGKSGKDNGILLLIAKEDREMRIEVGYGLEPELTDIESAHLIRNVLTPAFQSEQYFEGMRDAANLIIQKLGGENSEAFAEPAANLVPDFGAYAAFGFFVLAFISRLFAQTRSWWLGGVVGAAIAFVVSIFFGFFAVGFVAFLILIPLGFLIDFLLSRNWPGSGPGGFSGLGNMGGFKGGSSGGSFGGFGGGSSGGGGASGRW
jgi:uncharacterized protein